MVLEIVYTYSMMLLRNNMVGFVQKKNSTRAIYWSHVCFHLCFWVIFSDKFKNTKSFRNPSITWLHGTGNAHFYELLAYLWGNSNPYNHSILGHVETVTDIDVYCVAPKSQIKDQAELWDKLDNVVNQLKSFSASVKPDHPQVVQKHRLNRPVRIRQAG